MQTLSKILSILSSKNNGKNVFHLLEFLGKEFNATNVYIYKIHDSRSIAEKCFEWSSPSESNLQKVISVDNFSLDDFFSSEEHLAVSNISELSEKENISLHKKITVPFISCIHAGIYDEERLQGFIGICDCKKPHTEWTHGSPEFQLLKDSANILAIYFSNIRYRTEITKERNMRILEKNEHEITLNLISFTQKQISETLISAHIGMWNIIIGDGDTKFIIDETTTSLVGCDKDISPEEAYKFWYSNVDKNYIENVTSCIEKMTLGIPDEVIYPYHHPFKGEITIRCGGVSDNTFTGKGIRLRGYHQDVSEYSEKLQTERAKEFLKLMSEIANSGMWYFDLDIHGNRTRVNWSDKFRRMLGFKNEVDFPNTFETFVKRIHPDDKDEALKRYDEGIKGSRELNIKFRVKKKDGKYEWFNTHGTGARFANGKPRMFFGTFVNITQEENERHDMDERLGAILSGITGGLKICNGDSDFTINYMSESVAQIQGYTVQEFIKFMGGSMLKNCCDEDREALKTSLHEQYSRGNSYAVKYRVRHKNGNYVWLFDSGKRVTLPDGTIRYYSLIQDITKYENASENLRTERTMFRDAIIKNAWFSVFSDVTEGFVIEDVMSADGTYFIRASNRSVPVSFDEAAEAFVKKFKVQFLSKDAEKCFSCKGIESMYMEGFTAENLEIYLPTVDKYIRMMPLLSLNSHGHLICFCPCTDITETRKNEMNEKKILQDALTQAERANKAKTAFLNNMSHDIRTPMNAIIGFANLAQENSDDKEKVEEYLSKIQTSGKHLLSLINDVLDMSRIESGKFSIEESKTSISELLIELENIIFNDAHKKNLELYVMSEIPEDTEIWCDRLKLNQILLNCLSNSIKFTPVNGKIELNVKQAPCTKEGFSNYTFTIRDSGIGMTQKFISHIFDPFERERNTTVSGIQGTGLGMAITKNLVDKMGGTIKVESTINVGSTFIIELPFRTDKNKIHKSQTFEAKKDFTFDPNHKLHGIKILLAEDNNFNQEIVLELLSRNGAITSLATNGEEAVRMFAESDSRGTPYDIILMDIHMPVMDGYEASKTIRKLEGDYARCVPIIAMTANVFEEDKKMALSAGMNGHISKPFDIKTFYRTLNSFIEKK